VPSAAGFGFNEKLSGTNVVVVTSEVVVLDDVLDEVELELVELDELDVLDDDVVVIRPASAVPLPNRPERVAKATSAANVTATRPRVLEKRSFIDNSRQDLFDCSD
jgi:hypothetical protein